MFKRFKKSKVAKAVGTLFMTLVLLVVAYNPQAPVKPIPTVEASWPVIESGANMVANVASRIAAFASLVHDRIMSALAQAHWLKEFVLDTLVWTLINSVLEAMIRSVTDWVANGFQGSPAFLGNIGQFLTNVADEAFGELLGEFDAQFGTNLSFLCSPFSLDVTLSLALQYANEVSTQGKFDCSFSDVVGNIDNFINSGDFTDGGWQGWFELTAEPQNNPTGALLLGQHEAGIRITNAKGQNIKLLDFGEGYFSVPWCEAGEDCFITKPGATVQNVVSDTLNIPAGRLTIADEINELVAALFGQLVSTILNGAGGLLGLSNAGYPGNANSYWRDLTEQSQELANEVNQYSAEQLQSGLVEEIEFRDNAFLIRDLIDGLQEFLDGFPDDPNDPDFCQAAADAVVPTNIQSQQDAAEERLVVINNVSSLNQTVFDQALRELGINDIQSNLPVLDDDGNPIMTITTETRNNVRDFLFSTVTDDDGQPIPPTSGNLEVTLGMVKFALLLELQGEVQGCRDEAAGGAQVATDFSSRCQQFVGDDSATTDQKIFNAEQQIQQIHLRMVNQGQPQFGSSGNFLDRAAIDDDGNPESLVNRIADFEASITRACNLENPDAGGGV